jgi:APA family basic amino acid/polyamine antiporter
MVQEEQEHTPKRSVGRGEHSLKRSLGALNLTLLGIGAIIGAGIFVLTGTAAAQYAGPAISLSFVIAGLGCVFAGLCYAEFASMIPIAGSAYTYGYATLGEFVAWIIGWDLILEYLFAASTVAVGWSGYFTEFLGQLGIHIPRQFASAPFGVQGTHTLVASSLCVDPSTNALITTATCDLTRYQQVHGVLNIPAMALVAILTTLLVIGIQESARFNNAVVFLKIAIVILVIGFGFMYVNSAANWHPFIPANTGEFGHYGWSGVPARCGSDLLRVHRIRRSVDSGAGGEESTANLPIGDFASRHLHGALHPLWRW